MDPPVPVHLGGIVIAGSDARSAWDVTSGWPGPLMATGTVHTDSMRTGTVHTDTVQRASPARGAACTRHPGLVARCDGNTSMAWWDGHGGRFPDPPAGHRGGGP